MALGRLRRRSARAGAGVAEGVPGLTVDSCWILRDGSLAVDGWCLTEARTGGPLEVRCADAADPARTPWVEVLRKHRPDVAEHAFGRTGAELGTAFYGFVGHVPTGAAPGRSLELEFRDGRQSWTFRVAEPLDEAVPEDVFAWLDWTAGDPTPASVAAIARIVAGSRPVPPPASTVAYRHDGHGGTARVNVVVPVYAHFAYLGSLLLGLGQQGPGEVEVTVVCDDPSLTEGLRDWLVRWNDGVYGVPLQLLAHDRNAGFAAACNTGWSGSTSTFQLMLNSDVLMDRPAVDIARLASRFDDGVAAVAPTLLYPDGMLQHAGMELQASADFPGFVLPMHPGKGGTADGLPDEPFDVPLVTGAALLTTTELLREVGGVPPVFGRGDFEDVLLSTSLRAWGRLVVDPGVRWTHMEGASYRREEHGGVPLTLAKSLVIRDLLEDVS